jgi:starch phosphorylase
MSTPARRKALSEVEISDALRELALDLRWSYNHATDELWERVDPDLWDTTHNAWIVLQTVSRERLQSVATDPDFQGLLGELHSERRATERCEGWFQRTHPRSNLRGVAYFSMEFMLSEALPIYSGGLGNVAGDQLKAASSLGIPVVGVGLLYQQGYFRQEIDGEGRQQALYPSSLFESQTANGCACRSSFPAPSFGFGRGRPKWGERDSICSTRTTRRTHPRTAASPASSTEVGQSCA